MSVLTSVILAGYGFGWGNSIPGMLDYWKGLGIFDYALPFLLIFAVIFGVLNKSKIFGEPDHTRGINIVVALAAGLLAMQSESLRSFFQTIFPIAGIGLSILLVLLILIGLFLAGYPAYQKMFFWISFVIGVIVVLISLSNPLYGWSGGYWFSENWPAVITLAIIGILVALVVWKGSSGGGGGGGGGGAPHA